MVQRHFTITMMMILSSWMIIIVAIVPLPTSATPTTAISGPHQKFEWIQHHDSKVGSSSPTSMTATTTNSAETIVDQIERSPRRQHDQQQQLQPDGNFYLRRRQNQQQQRRHLPGNDMSDMMGNFDLTSAEAGFMMGFLSLIVLIFICLCCCCCGGRRRPYGYNNGGGGSNCLWDLVAIVCLWELCCDNDGIMSDGFMRF